MLQQLAERRAALERREQELDRRAALLATAEANVATQLERLEQLRAEIAATIATHDAKEDAKLASLVKIYETMKPKAAAEIFDRLEMPILIRVVERMRAAKIGGRAGAHGSDQGQAGDRGAGAADRAAAHRRPQLIRRSAVWLTAP